MTVDAVPVASIAAGFLVLLGVAAGDQPDHARRLASKVAGLRLFEDADGRMNLDLHERAGEILAVSQFTLYGDVRRGRRPSFEQAASGAAAAPLYEAFCAAIEAHGIPCRRGVFGARMAFELVNDGPVTLIIDTSDLEAPRRA